MKYTEQDTPISIPAAVSAAISSGRPQFVDVYIEAIKSGKEKPLKKDELVDLLKALRHVIDHLSEVKAEAARLRHAVQEANDAFTNIVDAVECARDGMDG